MNCRIAAVMTCYNRKQKTVTSIKRLLTTNEALLSFVVVDDNSTDGTIDALYELEKQYSIKVLNGNGHSYYTGGMRIGLKYLLDSGMEYDYLLLFNDDVEFYESCIDEMVKKSNQGENIVVGVCCDREGKMTYSAVRYASGFNVNYRRLMLGEENADTFCANCVLIPWKAFLSVGNMDETYTHSFGDFDYGFSLSRGGWNIVTSEKYIGVCEYNSERNTWNDKTLNRIERFKKKESVKGLPRKEWFHFLNKNFGFIHSIVFSCTPYIRILLGR